ncbi:MAG: nucleotidyltransferase domain-containing protein [Exilispira sp.]|jgi:predicted nucleotidyltransferase|nr:nucleotidyltransferase domain-containing protein [Exilispira sp.]
MEIRNIKKDKNLKLINEKINEIIKNKNINLMKIILFGSRARGDFSTNSDYDIMILTDNFCNEEMKKIIAKEIRTQLAKILIDADVIIISNSEYEEKKNELGSLIKYVQKEGIVL